MTEYIYGSVAFERIPEFKLEQREEIVRCRDCKHWATEARFTGMCVGKRFNPDGFCAWGERREQ